MSEILRVAFDHSVFLEQEYGGVTRYVLEVASRLSQLEGTELRIFAGLHLSKQLAEANLECSTGIYVPRIRKTFRIRSMLNHLGAKFAFRCWKPDVVHETYYTPTARVPKTTPTVVTVHDMIHELLPQNFPQDSPVRNWKRVAIERAAAVICVSDKTRNDLSSFLSVTGKELRVIHHSWNFFEPSRQSIDLVQKLVGGRPYILYVGKRHGYKNFAFFLSAFAQRSAVRQNFDVVCFGDAPFDLDELAIIDGLPRDCGKVIHLVGGDDALFACYKLAAAFVYPSLYEGFGIPILEAFAAGCPVICSDIDVFREVAGSASQFANPTSIEEWASSLDSVLGSESRREELCLQGRKRIGDFSWEKSAAAHRSLYADVKGI